MSTDPAIERVLSGQSWETFCDTIKVAGQAILRENSPADPLNRAEGFRYLARMTRAGLEAFIEHGDPERPVLRRPVHETVKMGADNPDNYYQHAVISGKHDYRLSGTRGTINYLGFGTYAGGYGREGRSAQTGYLEGKDLEVRPDGTLEVILSCKNHPGNWLPMEPDTSTLIVRQTFLDTQKETIADLKLERVGAESAPPPDPLTPAEIDEALTAAGRLVVGCAALFTNWAEDFARRPNELPPFDPGVSLAAHGDPNIFYYHGYWALAPDEALVVEADPPECDYWNFQVNNYWMESLDYRYHRISINKQEARYRPDGSVRIVVAHTDPGMENWIETAGHNVGTMCFRWVRARGSHPQPRTRVVKFDQLRHLEHLDG
jgi:hypothetical protein